MDQLHLLLQSFAKLDRDLQPENYQRETLWNHCCSTSPRNLRSPVDPSKNEEARFSMKKVFMLIALAMSAAIPASAQSDYPRGEIFVGYSHFSYDVNINNPFDTGGNPVFQQREGVHGVGFSGAANLTKNFGVVGDFSYHKKTFDVPGGDIPFHTFNFLFGPRVTARGDRVEGFAHFLVGGIQRKFDSFDSDVDLALGVGGGVDVKVSHGFGIRLVQVDYIPFRDRNVFTLDKEWRDNVRVQVGATFRF